MTRIGAAGSWQQGLWPGTGSPGFTQVAPYMAPLFSGMAHSLLIANNMLLL